MAVVFYVLSVATLLIYSLYVFSKRKYNYWKEQNVPFLEPKTIFGNYKDYICMKKYMGHVAQEICQQFPDKAYIGSFYGTELALIVRDPEMLKLITTKDFYYFSSREISKYTHNEVFTRNMFFTYGDRWQVIRQNFTPLFTSAKMKNMFHLIEKCSHVFEDLLDREAKQSVIEIRSLMARFTMDCIGSCVFGVDMNVMGDDIKNNPFRHMGNLVFENTNIRGLLIIARAIWPAIFYGVGLKAFPTKLDDFFKSLITGVFHSRNYEASPRHDIIDLILTLKKQEFMTGDSLSNMKTRGDKKVSIKVDDELMVAQCLSFFAAGYETSSTTLSFTLFELAKDQEAQTRAADEVDTYLEQHGNKLEYDCTKKLPYLTACVDETLRLHPVAPILTREVVEDYILPCGARLKPGIRIHIPMFDIHRNPENFPDPEKYNPERFLAENRHQIKPYTYIPFGEGPRICIGQRFSRMQMMAGLITVLKKYRVELAPGTKPDAVYEPRAITTQPKGGIHLRLVPREGETRVFAR